MKEVGMGFGLVGWKYAADLLLPTLSGSGIDLLFSSSSELAQAIVAAPQTIEVVNKFRVRGKKNDSVGVRFPDGDLHYAINNATLYLSRNASNKVAGTLYDYYDYKYEPRFGVTSMLVNEAFDLQQSGYLYTYNVYVDLQFD